MDTLVIISYKKWNVNRVLLTLTLFLLFSCLSQDLVGQLCYKDITPRGGPWGSFENQGTDGLGNIYFEAFADDDEDRSLYKSDGSSLTDITPAGGPWEGIKGRGTDGSGNIFFEVFLDRFDHRFYKYEGSTLTDITPAGGPWGAIMNSGSDGSGNTYFVIYPDDEDQRLYKCDGSNLTNITPAGGPWRAINVMGNDGSGNIYFRIQSDINDEKLYKSDGSTLTDITPAGGPWISIRGLGTDGSGNIYFGIHSDTNDEKLYKSDGSTVTDITPVGGPWISISDLGADGSGNIYFRIRSDPNDDRLYKSDGSTFTDLTPAGGPWTNIFTQGLDGMGNIYIRIFSDFNDEKLYKSDGSALTDLTPAGGPWISISGLGTDGMGNIHLKIHSDFSDQRMYKSDGSALTEITPVGGPWISISGLGTDGSGNIYFRIYSDTNDEKLYKSDGSTVTDITPIGSPWSSISGLGIDGLGNIYFGIASTDSDRRLYKFGADCTLDSDMDGVSDGVDNCPNTPNAGLEFDNLDDVITFSQTSNIPIGNQSYTIEAWFNANTMGGRGIVGWGAYGNNDQVNALRLTVNGFRNYWWSNDLDAVTGDITGAWHHVAATFDGTDRHIYLDGNLIANDQPGSGHNVPNADNLTIGRTFDNEYFDGRIDEVRIWNIARTEEEINSSLFEELNADETGLVAYYDFNEGQPSADNQILTTVFDRTGNGQNGSLAQHARIGPASNWVVGAPVHFIDVDNNGLGDYCQDNCVAGDSSLVVGPILPQTYQATQILSSGTVTEDCTWELLGSEGGDFPINGTQYIRYGDNGTYNFAILTDNVPCNNVVFGDPLAGVVKSCWACRTATVFRASDQIELSGRFEVRAGANFIGVADDDGCID